jgi:hypothetical protein
MKLPRSVKAQSLDFENSIGMTTIVMERVRGQARKLGQEMSDNDPPVGRVIRDGYGQEDERLQRSLGMRRVPEQTQTAGEVPRAAKSSGLDWRSGRARAWNYGGRYGLR